MIRRDGVLRSIARQLSLRKPSRGRRPTTWVYDDGGRHVGGFEGETGDCVARAVAIAAELPYREVYDALNQMITDVNLCGASARDGMPRAVYELYLMNELEWDWTPTMGIGTGCRVHLRADELPSGRVIARCSRHLTAVVDGVVRDTHDPTRGGTRCVYGYYTPPSSG